ncbi:FkbM family methyltransferase [Methylomarinum vadi]|uniref:FkbM family methyltransferase n=1 Tax=Methylomarinum vadi TaxID=438855 RepID=UPI000A9DB5D7|nr:FkbM family methyltransferase [Methylomarinum vadi]
MNKRYVRSNGLIFDLGMNNGDDTAYYLKKAVRVVAVEANPGLASEARARFDGEIRSGRLSIHQLAIWNDYGRVPFHISRENSHWSSLESQWADRNGGGTEAVQVECVPLAHLFALHGVPYFLKIDVEGVDESVIDQLEPLPYIPAYISMEDCRFGFRYVEKLTALGYDGFKLSNQALVAELADEAVNHRFPAGSSGPLGEQVPGEWHDPASFLHLYEQQVRSRDNERRSPPGVWWDIHARCGSPDKLI